MTSNTKEKNQCFIYLHVDNTYFRDACFKIQGLAFYSKKWDWGERCLQRMYIKLSSPVLSWQPFHRTLTLWENMFKPCICTYFIITVNSHCTDLQRIGMAGTQQRETLPSRGKLFYQSLVRTSTAKTLFPSLQKPAVQKKVDKCLETAIFQITYKVKSWVYAEVCVLIKIYFRKHLYSTTIFPKLLCPCMFFVLQYQYHSNTQDSWMWNCSQHLWSRVVQMTAKLRDLSQPGKVRHWANFCIPWK